MKRMLNLKTIDTLRERERERELHFSEIKKRGEDNV